MVPCNGFPEWQLRLYEIWRSFVVFIVRWLMPRKIRIVVFQREMREVRSTYPALKYWGQIDFEAYEHDRLRLMAEYRIDCKL